MTVESTPKPHPQPTDHEPIGHVPYPEGCLACGSKVDGLAGEPCNNQAAAEKLKLDGYAVLPASQEAIDNLSKTIR